VEEVGKGGGAEGKRDFHERGKTPPPLLLLLLLLLFSPRRFRRVFTPALLRRPFLFPLSLSLSLSLTEQNLFSRRSSFAADDTDCHRESGSCEAERAVPPLISAWNTAKYQFPKYAFSRAREISGNSRRFETRSIIERLIRPNHVTLNGVA